MPTTTHLVVVADREADIYPLFIVPRDRCTDLVVRATYDRGLAGGKRLVTVAAQVAWRGTRSVTIPGNGTRKTRTATVQLGWTEVQMLPPTDDPTPVSAPRPTVQLVVVEERDPPAGSKPLRW